MRAIAISDEPASLNELIAAGEPRVLRGRVREWHAVKAARISAAAAKEYLCRFDNGTPVDAVMMPPEAEGRIFYNAEMTGFNFIRNRLSVSAVAAQVMRYAAFERAPAVAVQSAALDDCLPGFVAENPMRMLDAAVRPRIWLGNAITTPTHLDEWHNLACVVSGRRRFTLFPPEQIPNLYIGPLDFAPTGAPMSLVELHRPDFTRFPRFRAALEAALGAELAPGDALYLPPLWWHHVESLDRFNVLVNYWWHAGAGQPAATDSGFDALILAILNLRSLPAPARAAWGALLNHCALGEPSQVTGHIPPARHGVLGQLSKQDLERWRAYLIEKLQRGS